MKETDFLLTDFIDPEEAEKLKIVNESEEDDDDDDEDQISQVPPVLYWSQLKLIDSNQSILHRLVYHFKHQQYGLPDYSENWEMCTIVIGPPVICFQCLKRSIKKRFEMRKNTAF